MPRRPLLLLPALLFLFQGLLLAPPAVAQPRCTYALGFKALHDLIPRLVGD